MPSVAEFNTWPFVSVVAWPPAYDREQTARLLGQSRGLDLPTLRLRLGQAAPMVLERVEPRAAGEMVSALIDHGGDGFAFTLDDLAALGPTLTIKGIEVCEGALALDLWAGVSTTIPLPSVQVVIRAHLRKSVTRRREPPRMSSTFRPHRTWQSIKAEIEASGSKDLVTSDKLDLHTSDGSVYQIDGDRFGFEVLGELRGHSDKANMDNVCELLAHLCPEAVLDTYFEVWRPPPGHDRLKVSHMSPKEDRAFTFYSRWAALTYRHVMSS